MDNHIVFVTGAAGGIGLATVANLLSREVHVAAVDLDLSPLARFRDDAKAFDRLMLIEGDISDRDMVKQSIDRVTRQWGGLSAVLNNAGIEGPVKAIGECSEAEFDRVFSVNVKGTWLVAKYSLPHLEESRGAIVNVASTAGIMGWPRLVPYVASKHAVVGLTRAMAMEVAPQGVRVNAVCPGPTDTRMLRSIGEANAPGDPVKATRLQTINIPVRRLGTPEEIAAAAAWLLLDAPDFMTGSLLAVDGGQTGGFSL